MIRGALCIVLALASVLAAIPNGSSHNGTAPTYFTTFSRPAFFGADPNGTKSAFNTTLANFDLYTMNNVTFISPSSNITWSSTLNNTVNGQPIPNTTFRFSINSSIGVTRLINYSLTIPRGAGSTTFLRFDWNGTIKSGGSRYILSNSTKIVLNVAKIGNFTGGAPLNATSGNIPISCGSKDECFDVTKFIGFNLTLTFMLNSTATPGRAAVTVSNIEVASVNTSLNQAASHSMFVNTNDSTQIVHKAKIRVVYNSTQSYPKPPLPSTKLLNHTWRQMILTFFFPSSYKLDQNATLDGVGFLPAAYPFSQGSCATIGLVECTNVSFLSLNMTAPLDRGNRTALFTARTLNAVASIQTTIAGMTADFWAPGENTTLQVRNRQGVNLTGTQAAWFTDPRGILPVNNQTLSSNAIFGLNNYTVTLPGSPLGNWTITAVFKSSGGFDRLPFDYGIMSHGFSIDELQLKPSTFAATGGVGSGASLNVVGSLVYGSNSLSAGNLNATVFAVASGPGASLVSATGGAASGLYLSNITMVNGIGTVGTPIVLYFSIVNPTPNGFDANLTVEHEWAPNFAHGINATIPLKMGDEPFNNTKSFTYSVQATLSATGFHLVVQSLTTNNKKTADMTVGSSAVPFLRQHSGLFKMTLHTKNRLSNVTTTTSPVESPPYAYLLYAPILPARLLAYSLTTISSGSISTSLRSDNLVGVKKLLIIILARDANGVTLGDAAHDPSAAKDTTILTPTVDLPSDAAVGQQVTATLHLKSNATAFPMTLTVNLDITGSGSSVPTQPKTVTIAPGATQDVSFSFTTPATAGTYLVTFSSPQYGSAGSALLSKTLQVSLVSSNLQILIPVLIGLVAAIIIVAVYILRKEPAEEEGSEKTKPAPSKSSKPPSGTQPRNA